ncbi:LysM peptidoglycan-binding domain-containing protein [Tepidamorphus sp. 3E244]|uniref:LysM peptidoglycan-binding domain-containing protein n=1 Tax=Tepidamorphus sp. 3E244 TaxID=3385498 RepID=UPI0038FC7D62
MLALTVAACSTDTTRFSQPMFTSSNDYTGSITPREGVGYGGVSPDGQAAPTGGGIQQAPIAAPGNYPSQTYPSQSYPSSRPGSYGSDDASAPVYSQQTYTPPPQNSPYGSAPGGYDGSPSTVSSTRPGPSASPAGGTVVTVEPSETLYSISRRYGVPVDAIMQANGITDARSVRVGQQLTIPQYSATRSGWVTGPQPAASRASPPIITTPTPRAASPVATSTYSAPKSTPAVQRSSASGSHTVQSGETLYSISRRYGVSIEALQAQNGITSPSQIRVGQSLSIPNAGSTAAVINTQAQPAVSRSSDPAPVRQASAPAGPQPEPEPSAASADEPVNTASIPAPQAINEGFRWPARGRVISGFGEPNSGSVNEGINIAVPEGTSVRAAENGVVIYSGSELEGLGNLVLVRHSDNWVTAYAHNRDLRVNRGDKVTRGQIIATAGQTGKVKSPQLHFELRKGSKPVDPLRYLSAL